MDEIKLGGNVNGERAARQRLVVMDAEQFDAVDGCPKDMSVLLERQLAVGIRIRRARLFADLFIDDLRAWNDGFRFGGKWLGRKDFIAFHQRERSFQRRGIKLRLQKIGFGGFWIIRTEMIVEIWLDRRVQRESAVEIACIDMRLRIGLVVFVALFDPCVAGGRPSLHERDAFADRTGRLCRPV